MGSQNIQYLDKFCGTCYLRDKFCGECGGSISKNEALKILLLELIISSLLTMQSNSDNGHYVNVLFSYIVVDLTEPE